MNNLDQAYAHCMAIARGHYENFPVASRMMPPRLRRPISVIYAFARSADDLADEGTADTATRLHGLDEYVSKLDRLRAGDGVDDPIFIALADVVRRHGLPWSLFYDLLRAFRMDVTKKRYADFTDVLAYCRYSANPVGRLLLYLFDAADDQNLQRSDAVCSALQLINFYQDLAQDYCEMGRIYLPQDEMSRFGVTEDHLRNRITDESMRRLMAHQIDRARDMLAYGAPLGWVLPGRMGLELRLIIAGGFRILDALGKLHGDLYARPRLRKMDWLRMLGEALWKRYPAPEVQTGKI